MNPLHLICLCVFVWACITALLLFVHSRIPKAPQCEPMPGAPELCLDKTPRGQKVARKDRGGSAHERRKIRWALERANAI